MATFAFLLDMGRCIGCQACVAACKTGNELPEHAQYIRIGEKTAGAFPRVSSRVTNHRCYHCTDAACVTVCPTGALSKQDGLTRLDRAKCSGCSYCVDACPFGVPLLYEGRSSKCDACAEVVKAGGSPWCVKTCPSNALMYGEREQILAEAKARLTKLQKRYPDARLYGETEAGGLGMIMVLPDEPETFGLPANPEIPLAVKTWQKAVQPASIGLTGLSVLVTGIAAVIARRNHMKELQLIHQARKGDQAKEVDASASAQEKEEVQP